MTEFTQADRELVIETPLGQDKLLLEGMELDEKLCSHFTGSLSLLSEDKAIDPLKLLGKKVTVKVRRGDDEAPRVFIGHVTSFVSGSMASRGLRRYEARIASWTWFLTRTRDYRIFQEKSAWEIAEEIFKERKFTDYEFKDGAKSAPKRDFCVQFGETAYDFIARLFEEEGIFWFVRHDDAKDVLVIGGAAGVFQKCARETVMYSDGTLVEPHILFWREEVRFDTGKWASTDYNFEKPADLEGKRGNTAEKVASSFLATGADAYEIFEFPGRYVDASRGGNLAKIRAEAIEGQLATIQGLGNCPEFATGTKFKLQGFEADPSRNDKEFVIRSVKHRGAEPGYLNSDEEQQYINSFEVMPAEAKYRPPAITARPRADGIHCATVVGPSGEEIYTDKYGRVKVQFHWDRKGKKDEKSSCWVRVAQGWAGEKWGAICIPRIGQEVLVEFVAADADRPIVTGRVYNADQMPPYELPGNMTQSGVKSRSSKSGDAKTFNELRFEDKKDAEEVYFHAERNFTRIVENDDVLKVGLEKKDKGNQTIEIQNDRTETVKEGNETVSIEKGNRKVTIGQGDETLDVKQGKRTVNVDTGDDELNVKTGNRTVNVKTGDRTVNVKMGNDSHNVDMGDRSVVVKMGNDSLDVQMGNQTTKLALGKSSTEALQSIELKVMGSSIKIDPMGVTIKGMMIKIEGQMMTEMKGLMTTVEGTGMATLKGGIMMIN